MTEISDREGESVELDQTARMCRLIWLDTLKIRINIRQNNKKIMLSQILTHDAFIISYNKLVNVTFRFFKQLTHQLVSILFQVSSNDIFTILCGKTSVFYQSCTID